jgi:hypothetical protein
MTEEITWPYICSGESVLLLGMNNHVGIIEKNQEGSLVNDIRAGENTAEAGKNIRRRHYECFL